MNSLYTIISNNKPRCLEGVRGELSEPIEPRNCVSITYRLSEKTTGHNCANVLGYPLCKYNLNFKDSTDFISPVTLRWPDTVETPIFDSDIHGYHGEMNISAKLRGEGSQEAFTCANCGAEEFFVKVQLDYWDACADLIEDEPDTPVQDFFCNIIIQGTCAKCSGKSRILDMDL